MIRQSLLSLLILFLVNVMGTSQKFTGLILDAETNDKLIGANVILTKDGEFITGAASNIDGKFLLDLSDHKIINVAVYQIEVSYTGFHTNTRRLGYMQFERLKNDGHATFNIHLKRDITIIGCPIIRVESTYVNAFNYEKIDKEEIKNVETLNPQQLYNTKPGLFMHSGALNTNRLTIRGIGSRSPFSTTKIKAFLNDIPLTNGIGETNLEDLNLFMVDEIEIMKGPTAPKFGAGLGGVIHYRTKNSLRQKTEYKTKIGYGSFNTIRVNQNVNSKEKDAIYSLNYDLLKSDGYRDNNEFLRHSLTGFSQFEIGRFNTLTIFGNLVDLDAQIPSGLNIEDFKTTPSAAAGNWKGVEGFEDYQKIQLGITLQRRLDKNWNSSMTGFINTFENYERRPFNVLTQFAFGFGTRLQFIRRLSDGEFRIGTELLVDKERWETFETLDEGQGSILSNNFENRKFANVFAQYEKSWNVFQLTAGANLNYTIYDFEDYFQANGLDKSSEYSFDPILSPFVSLSYRKKPKEIYFLSFSHGFSAPTLEETLTPNGVVNPAIDPETGWNVELGIRKEIKGIEIEASIYHLWAQNLLVSERISEDQTIGVNAGRTNHPGLELAVKKVFRFNNQSLDLITAGVNYQYSPHVFKSFVNNEIDFQDKFLPGNPKQKFNAFIHFTHERWHANLNNIYVGKMFADDGNTIIVNDYNLVNFNLSYEFFKTKHWSIRFGGSLNNILDEEYSSMIAVNPRSFGSSLPRYLYAGLPRNYFTSLQVKYRFK